MLRLKKIIGFSILAAYIVVMMSFVNIAYEKETCGQINIAIKDSATTRFVQENDILRIIEASKFNISDKKPGELDRNLIENEIKKHSSIDDCQCYLLANREMRIDITQRHPIARIITRKYNCYIDEDGQIMPPSKFYTAHVPIVTGYVNDNIITTDLYTIAKMIHNDTFLEAQIEQINVEANGDYCLIPRAGRQVIELGDAANLKDKFINLKALYLEVFNKNSWNKYEKISLKFDGQVICTKK